MANKEHFLQVERSWGVGNFRQTAGFPVGENRKYDYVCPLGSSVAIWNIEKKQIEKFNQLAFDLIVCLLKCHDRILMISYSGKGKILNLAFESIFEFEIPGGNVAYASWAEDGDRFCVCTIGPKSVIALFELGREGTGFDVVWLKHALNTKEQTEVKDKDYNEKESCSIKMSSCEKGIGFGSKTSFSEKGEACESQMSEDERVKGSTYITSLPMKGEDCESQVSKDERVKGSISETSLHMKAQDCESQMSSDERGNCSLMPSDDREKHQVSQIQLNEKLKDSDSQLLSTSIDNTHLTYSCYYGCIFTDNDSIFAVFKEDKKPCEGHLFNKSGLLLKKQSLSPFGEQDASMMCLSSCKNQNIAIGLQRGLFMFIDCNTLEMKSVFQAQGSSQVCIWDRDVLLTASYQNGTLQWWNVGGELLKEVSISPIDSVIHLNWSVPGKELWIGGITSLNYICLNNTDSITKAETKFHLRLHRLAGCGLSYKNSDILATGDLSGNVMVWDKTSEVRISQPVLSIDVKESVRSLCWFNTELFIGTLNGDLFKWKPDVNETQCTKVYQFRYSALTIKKASNFDKIAVGTSGGDVFVFDVSDDKLLLKLEKQVHAPMPVSTGLENQPMEIWSVSWNPTDEFLATASEDKTSIIIDAKDGHKIATLTGHTTAVTSIDWRVVDNLGCIIATCADDRTVRVTDGITFELMKILKTDVIYGWYTLTYLAINTVDNLISCSTQNGFIIIWDLRTDDCLVCKRMHCGSVEGLSWDASMTSFATIGSDCVANIFKLK